MMSKQKISNVIVLILFAFSSTNAMAIGEKGPGAGQGPEGFGRIRERANRFVTAPGSLAPAANTRAGAVAASTAANPAGRVGMAAGLSAPTKSSEAAKPAQPGKFRRAVGSVFGKIGDAERAIVYGKWGAFAVGAALIAGGAWGILDTSEKINIGTSPEVLWAGARVLAGTGIAVGALTVARKSVPSAFKEFFNRKNWWVNASLIATLGFTVAPYVTSAVMHQPLFDLPSYVKTAGAWGPMVGALGLALWTGNAVINPPESKEAKFDLGHHNLILKEYVSTISATNQTSLDEMSGAERMTYDKVLSASILANARIILWVDANKSKPKKMTKKAEGRAEINVWIADALKHNNDLKNNLGGLQRARTPWEESAYGSAVTTIGKLAELEDPNINIANLVFPEPAPK